MLKHPHNLLFNSFLGFLFVKNVTCIWCILFCALNSIFIFILCKAYIWLELYNLLIETYWWILKLYFLFLLNNTRALIMLKTLHLFALFNVLNTWNKVKTTFFNFMEEPLSDNKMWEDFVTDQATTMLKSLHFATHIHFLHAIL